MTTISVIGIGAGDPEHLTLQAVRVLNDVDVVFVTDKGATTAELVDARVQVCQQVITDQDEYRLVVVPDPPRDRRSPAYREAVEDWRRERALVYDRLIRDELADGGHGAFLAWGDPALYDSILPVLDHVRQIGTAAFDVQVVPGVSSLSALAAGHATTWTRTGRPVQITTGRLLAAHGLPADVDDVAVMLDGGTAFDGLDPDLQVFWGAYVGTDHELLVSGRLGDVADRITALKAAAREEHGWIMDSYLLRRAGP
jgi:precorrin-6A synthase